MLLISAWYIKSEFSGITWVLQSSSQRYMLSFNMLIPCMHMLSLCLYTGITILRRGTILITAVLHGTYNVVYFWDSLLTENIWISTVCTVFTLFFYGLLCTVFTLWTKVWVDHLKESRRSEARRGVLLKVAAWPAFDPSKSTSESLEPMRRSSSPGR